MKRMMGFATFDSTKVCDDVLLLAVPTASGDGSRYSRQMIG